MTATRVCGYSSTDYVSTALTVTSVTPYLLSYC